MDLFNNIFLAILVTLIFLIILVHIVACFIRLESKVEYLEKDYERHHAEAAEKYKNIRTKVEAIQLLINAETIEIGKISAKLENKND